MSWTFLTEKKKRETFINLYKFYQRSSFSSSLPLSSFSSSSSSIISPIGAPKSYILLTMERQIIQLMGIGCFVEHKIELILALDIWNMVLLGIRPRLRRWEERINSQTNSILNHLGNEPSQKWTAQFQTWICIDLDE